MRRTLRSGFTSTLLLAALASSGFTTTINLKSDFVEKYRLRVTVEATMAVDAASSAPKSLSQDADIHIAGRSEEIGLQFVAEPMNAYEAWGAFTLANQLATTGGSTSIKGVYRIWPEHGGTHAFTQGAATTADPGNTNPDHIFEVHPLTKFGPYDLTHTIRMIPGDLTGTLGYRYRDPEDAFAAYEAKAFTLTHNTNDDFYQAELTMVGYNYIAITIKPDFDTVMRVEDGAFINADVEAWDGTDILDDVRMVFVAGTEAMRALDNAERVPSNRRKKMRILAMPRLSFQKMWQIAMDSPGTTNTTIPYEMVVVGYAGIARN